MKIENYYDVWSDGSISSARTGKYLKPQLKKTGYLQVLLNMDGVRTSKLMHRLVAEKYLPNPKGLPCINHIDLDKTNNNVTNLEWCDYVHNNRNRGNNKITQKDVKAIKELCKTHTQTYVANLFNLNQGYVSQLLNDKRRKNNIERNING